MGDFFRSKFFILLVAICFVLIGFSIFTISNRSKVTGIEDVVAIIITPLQKISAKAVDTFQDFSDYFKSIDDIKKENEDLKEKNANLQYQLSDYNRYKVENDNMKEYLKIKDLKPEFDLEISEVIARTPGDFFTIFTIDKGTLAGISIRDCVIVPEGLVGYVYEVGANYAKVLTILDVNTQIGARISRTRDVALIEGNLELATQGLSRLSYLSKELDVKPGDLVETSGLGDIFPKGILIGTILEVLPDPYGISEYAVVKPIVDFKNIRSVFVIKSFKNAEEEVSANQSQENTNSKDESK